MYVCICNAITEKQIRTAAESGARDLWDLQAALGVAAGCGTCRESAMDVLTAARRGAGDGAPRLYTPSAA